MKSTPSDKDLWNTIKNKPYIKTQGDIFRVFTVRKGYLILEDISETKAVRWKKENFLHHSTHFRMSKGLVYQLYPECFI